MSRRQVRKLWGSTERCYIAACAAMRLMAALDIFRCMVVPCAMRDLEEICCGCCVRIFECRSTVTLEWVLGSDSLLNFGVLSYRGLNRSFVHECIGSEWMCMNLWVLGVNMRLISCMCVSFFVLMHVSLIAHGYRRVVVGVGLKSHTHIGARSLGDDGNFCVNLHAYPVSATRDSCVYMSSWKQFVCLSENECVERTHLGF